MAADLPRPAPEGGFNFTWDPSVAHLNMSMKDYLATNTTVEGTATGALVFSKSKLSSTTEDDSEEKDRILLVQRAPADSMPLAWEVPGGGCDWGDETLLYSLARELWEESRLVLKHVVRQVGEPYVFFTRRGRRIAKLNFEADVERPAGDGHVLPEVTLDPNEHVRFLWATEDECRRHKVVVPGGDDNGEGEVVEIQFTTKGQLESILDGFQLRREVTNSKAAI
ncbi:NUDIX hydrolase domain-like protein [Podospora didyma]|uniref:NUDIX hydrolase domain-like protein n=1 Tax=Podospora didyma TaxID=330526 RepID=A0AAE0KF16_9PEZI|nr:NUDIX hydrolase domain-like protein [Podospora didyma]